MKMSMDRVIQLRPYETIRLSVEMNEDDLAGFPFESMDVGNRLHLALYARILRFEVFHNHISAKDAKQEFARAKRFYQEEEDDDSH